MKLNKIYETADAVAPFALSREYCEKYGAYDNSGIILDCGKDVTKVLFSLDCSKKSVEAAKKAGAQLLFTHHPAIFSAVRNLQAENAVLQCAMAEISIISAHLNLDCAVGGIDDSLAFALGGTPEWKMCSLSQGGYGSVYSLIKPLSLREFVSQAKETLNTARVLSYGNSPVKRVASFCGSGMDEESVRFALEKGADTLVSSDPKHHVLSLAQDNGLNVVVLTHYAAENYGFEKFYHKIKEKISDVQMEYFTDNRLL